MLLVFLAFVVVLEIGLRIFVGLGSPLLFEKSDVFEYYVAPFQDVVRDGNRIVSYDFGLKSRCIPCAPDAYEDGQGQDYCNSD